MSPKSKMYMTANQINLMGVQKRLQDKEGFDKQRTEATINMYRRFLEMIQSNPAEIMVPNEDVDIAWHHHILDTQAYTNDCQNLFGRYLHHNPNFYGTDAFFEACDKTQCIYENEYGNETFVSKAARNRPTLSVKPANCGGMLKDDIQANLKPANCGGMLKDDIQANLKPANCGGMLKDDVQANLKPANCGGMLKDDVQANLKPANCGGMLKDDVQANLKPANCGGMLKDEEEINLNNLLQRLFSTPESLSEHVRH